MYFKSTALTRLNVKLSTMTFVRGCCSAGALEWSETGQSGNVYLLKNNIKIIWRGILQSNMDVIYCHLLY